MPQVNRIIRGFIAAACFAGIELMIYYPVVLLYNHFLSTVALGLTIAHLLAFYLLGYIGGATNRLNRGIYEWLFAAAASSLLLYIFAGWTTLGAADWAIGLLLARRGVLMAKSPWTALFPLNAYLYGLAIYCIGVPIMSRIPATASYVPATNLLGFCSLVIFLFYLNRTQLLQATLSVSDKAQSALSGSVRRLTRLWLIVIIAVITAISFFQQLKAALLTFGGKALALLASLLFREPEELEFALPEATPTPTPEDGAGMAPQESGWLKAFIDEAMFILGYVIVAAFIIYVLYLIVTQLIPFLARGIRRLFGRNLAGEAAAASRGYSDEKEVLVDWKQLPEVWLNRLSQRLQRKRPAAARWSGLTSNRERIRFLYAAFVRTAVAKGLPFQPSLTPLETAQELAPRSGIETAAAQELAAFYAEARYGGKELNDADIERLIRASSSLLPKD